MEIKITITDAASSIEQQASLSGTNVTAAVAPATEHSAAPPSTGVLGGINAGPAPAALSAAGALDPLAFMTGAEGHPASGHSSDQSAGSAPTF
jgi:hypothetical protein